VQAPSGTVALLFTDIEGSTRLARELGPAWADVLADHGRLVGGAIEAEGGWIDGTEGDSFFATFADPVAGARAAVAALRALRAHAWPEAVGGELGVRMGLHVGHVVRRETGYVGLEVHRAARVGAAAHGGQLLLTASADALCGEAVPTEPLGGHRLKDFPVPEQLFCAVVDGRGAAAFPPPRTLDVRPTNLPAGTTPLIGREADLEAVRSALLGGGERLVTLTGRGGTGKTSLAREAGIALLDEHPAGVWWVPLAALSAAEDVVPAIVSALQADGRAGTPPEALVVDRLRDRGAVLLILDNLEQLVGAAPALERLLDALPELRILATSQLPLRLHRERLLPLDTLEDDAALALVERTAERAGARLTGHRDALLELVHLLDGLPLALELAAARLRVLTSEQLLTRLAESTALLKDRSPDRDERHRSLQATVEWTLELLDDDARALFARMGAFARPAEIEELEAVAGADGLDVLDAIAMLLDVALVRRVEDGDGSVRFGLPEALRQIAAAQLDAAPDGADWRLRHAEHQLEIAWAARFAGLSPLADHRRAEANSAESRAALRWARAAGAPLADRLAAAMGMRMADMGRTADTLEVLGGLAGTPSGDLDVDALVAIAEGYILLVRGDAGAAVERVDLARAQDPGIESLRFSMRGFMRTACEDTAGGVEDSVRGSELARQARSPSLAGALLLEAQAHLFHGDFERARERFADAERADALIPTQLLTAADTFRGDFAMRLGRPEEALEPYARSMSTAEARGNDLQVLFDLLGVATALAACGRDVEAIEATGLAEAQGVEVASMSDFAGASFTHLLGDAAIVAARDRLGDAAREPLARGRAVPAGRRVATACALALAAPVT
jgi:class 3 adenylate cyclase/predicted ATPase